MYFLFVSKNYKYIDHTADIAAEINGGTMEELYTAGAEAWLNSVVEEIYLETGMSNAVTLNVIF